MNNQYEIEIWEDEHVLFFRVTAEGIDYWVGGVEPSPEAVLRGWKDAKPLVATDGDTKWKTKWQGPGCG